MAGRFPGSPDVTSFWQHVENGDECIHFFSKAELIEAGIPESVLDDPAYVRARGILDHHTDFDARFFGYTPAEAVRMDVQLRVFLECAWAAIESSGTDPDRFGGHIGVYAGSGMSTYLLRALQACTNDPAQAFQMVTGNDKDFIATTAAYHFNLRGPALSVQTACSTSLVAVHVACQALLSGECDMALAGGVNIYVPQQSGYYFQPGMILSPDGHCRPFDAKAAGTVAGNGCGLVVLKRYRDAVKDGNTVHAIILGSAVNNDAADRAGFNAPSVRGQQDVILEAQAVAEVDPRSISYIEAHGTGTELGDPIEIQALSGAFARHTNDTGFCAVGSVKSNIGHLNTAAGIAGLIKTVLALKQQKIPPTVHFKRPNPQIDFEKSAVYVAQKLTGWQSLGPRIAGVSSFGIGGTNAHVILQEARQPQRAPATEKQERILLLSAKSANAVQDMAKRLSGYMQDYPLLSLVDIEFTLSQGRRNFPYRLSAVGPTTRELCAQLADHVYRHKQTPATETRPAVVFLFPGQGSQYVNMGRYLYEHNELFCNILQQGAALFRHIDLLPVIYPQPGEERGAEHRLRQTEFSQPALFLIEYALARLWQSWGIEPDAMLGHSIGEYAAACLSGALSLQDAVYLVSERGRLLEQCRTGSMLAVRAPVRAVAPLLDARVDIAAVNTPEMLVLSGPDTAIKTIRHKLESAGFYCHPVHTSHAFHSAMMDPVLGPFAQKVSKITVHSNIKIPYVSALTANWIGENDSIDPSYWVDHIRQPVNFSRALETILKRSDPVFVECGPGNTLSTFVNAHTRASGCRALYSLPHPKQNSTDMHRMLKTASELWKLGCEPDWSRVINNHGRRIPLPTYPFERQCYSLDSIVKPDAGPAGRLPPENWFYRRIWKQVVLSPQKEPESNAQWLLFVNTPDDPHIDELKDAGHQVTVILPDVASQKMNKDYICLNWDCDEELLQRIDTERPVHILYAWSACPDAGKDEHLMNKKWIQNIVRNGLMPFVRLIGLLGRMPVTRVKCILLLPGLYRIAGDERVSPAPHVMVGTALCMAQERQMTTCVVLDSDGSHFGHIRLTALFRDGFSPIYACRHRRLWQPDYAMQPLDRNKKFPFKLKTGGSYLITGGLGRIGLLFAGLLGECGAAHLYLIGRSAMPPQSQWQELLSDHRTGEQLRDKLKALQHIKDRGTILHLCTGDVSDSRFLSNVLKKIDGQSGLDGLIHAAGSTGPEAIAPLEQTEQNLLERHFAAKVYGTLELYRLLKDRQLDFAVLMSSLSAVLGGLGFSAYAGANAFLDAFARWTENRGAASWLSVGWDGWRFDKEKNVCSAHKDTDAIKPSEGSDAFLRILTVPGVTHWIVSTTPLKRRLAKWVLQSDRRQDSTPAPPESGYRRPELSTAYAEPRNEIEACLADIFSTSLGIERIGIHDGFFELGGHSLMAGQIVARIQDSFNIRVDLRMLFDKSTIAQCAEYLTEKILEKADDQDIDSLLSEMYGSKDEES